MTFTNFDKRMFQMARLEAEKSTFNRFKVGAVITYRNKIIGRGHNSEKTDPMQKKYNELYRNFNNSNSTFVKHSVHAEVSAIKSISYTVGIEVDWSKVSIYVYRICPGKKLGYGCSRPCPACMNALRDLNIRRVFFTSDDGYSYLELR